jgi:DNA-binding MarR family transcriptional regulator
MGRVVRKYELKLAEALREHDLSPIGWRLLLRLNARDGDNTTTLASRTTYERSSVVRALEKLERKKLVRRSNHHEDRRNSIVNITSAGRAVFRRAAQSVQRVRENAYAGLTASHLGALDDVLGNIGRNLNG